MSQIIQIEKIYSIYIKINFVNQKEIRNKTNFASWQVFIFFFDYSTIKKKKFLINFLFVDTAKLNLLSDYLFKFIV